MKTLVSLSFRSLKKNRTKTVITSLGILLTVILLATIIILFSSYKTSLIATIINKKGDWHLLIANNSNYGIVENKVDKFAKLNELGYSKILDNKNSEKPYLHITEISTNYRKMLNINILEGNFPKNNNEIIIPIDYAKLYGKKINDVLELYIGTRKLIDETIPEEFSILNQRATYAGKEKEHIINSNMKEYKIVGICETLSLLEYGFSPGYSMLTYNETENFTQAYIKLKNPADAYSLFSENSNVIYNNDLLDILGLKKGESTGKLFNMLISSLIIIIFLISFILIYNSYMLTLNERLKDYSLLTSIGATNRQLFLISLIENIILCLIFIPLGLVVAIVTLGFSLNSITNALTDASYLDIVFKLNLKFEIILGIALLSFLMIIISSITPFLFSLKKTAITNLRQNEIIKIKQKSIKSRKKQRKNISVECDMIFKNYRRFKNKYKFTAISIIISIALFVSIDIVCKYAINQLNNEFSLNYEIYCDSYGYALNDSIDNIYKPLSHIEGIERSWWVIQEHLGSIEIEEELFTNEASKFFKNSSLDVYCIVIENGVFDKLLKSIGKDKNDYNISNTLRAPAIGVFHDSFSEGENYYLLKEGVASIAIEHDVNLKTDKLVIDVVNKELIEELAHYNTGFGIYVFLPLEKANEHFLTLPDSVRMYFKTSSHKSIYKEMVDMQKLNSWNVYINDYAEDYDKQLNTINIVNVFSKIFVLIISIISFLNIFNTVLLNIFIRRKEFAILTSIGMTDKSIRKIIFLENFIICVFSIIIGLVISILVALSFKLALNSEKLIFAGAGSISLILIFVVVTLCASIIAIKKNSKTNIIDTLKKDFV